jgi:ferredoxin
LAIIIKGGRYKMKAVVDKDLCTGCGLCEDTCPEVFEMKDSIAIVKVSKVPEDLIESCKQAADDCPVEAITCE